LWGSKKYPFLSHGRGFSLDPPTPLEIPVKLHTQMFGPLTTPHPQGISNPFHGGSMDIFWNYTLSNQYKDNSIRLKGAMSGYLLYF